MDLSTALEKGLSPNGLCLIDSRSLKMLCYLSQELLLVFLAAQQNIGIKLFHQFLIAKYWKTTHPKGTRLNNYKILHIH